MLNKTTLKTMAIALVAVAAASRVGALRGLVFADSPVI